MIFGGVCSTFRAVSMIFERLLQQLRTTYVHCALSALFAGGLGEVWSGAVIWDSALHFRSQRHLACCLLHVHSVVNPACAGCAPWWVSAKVWLQQGECFGMSAVVTCAVHLAWCCKNLLHVLALWWTRQCLHFHLLIFDVLGENLSDLKTA